MSETFEDSYGLHYRVHLDPSSAPNNERWMIQVGSDETGWSIATTFNYTPLDSFRSKVAAEQYLIANIERIL